MLDRNGKGIVGGNPIQHEKMLWVWRLLLMFGIAALHSACYYLVNHINGLKPAASLLSFHTFVDNWIPYIPWTWVFYYLGDVYILLAAGLILWRLENARFVRAIYVYIGMIMGGALIQLALPSICPWPDRLSWAQDYFHNFFLTGPHACLPSMHVALTVLPGCILFSVTASKWIRVLSTLMVVLNTVSTVTMKEHYFLDLLTGVLFALFFYAIWKRGDKTPAKAYGENPI
jgi:hypothetical protein